MKLINFTVLKMVSIKRTTSRWFINGVFHGNQNFSDYSSSLASLIDIIANHGEAHHQKPINEPKKDLILSHSYLLPVEEFSSLIEIDQ